MQLKVNEKIEIFLFMGGYSNIFERLGKLQKWILTSCYKTTVLLDNSCIGRLDGKDPYSCDSCTGSMVEGKENITVEKDKYNCICNRCNKKSMSCDCFNFYREDILLTYFKLAKSRKWANTRIQHFKHCPEYRKAHVSVTRTLQNLMKNDYIGLYGGGEYSTLIKLTDKGASRAAELLGLEYIMLPPKTEEQAEEEKRKLDLYCQSLLKQFS